MIWSRTGGPESGPLLVLLPGLGATAEVFAGIERVLADSWSGGWLAVDLPGHGRSDWDSPYTFAGHAEAVRSLLPHDRDLAVLGHSMGGVVALELADGSAPVPTAVTALGVKVSWPEEHVAAAARMAARPATHVASRAEAVDRYLKLAGLTGLVDPTDPTTDAGVVETPEGWRVAQDPATFGVGVPDMAGLLARAVCPVILARVSATRWCRRPTCVIWCPHRSPCPGSATTRTSRTQLRSSNCCGGSPDPVAGAPGGRR